MVHCTHPDKLITRVSCQKGPTRHAYAWQIGPFWQDTLEDRWHTWQSMIEALDCRLTHCILKQMIYNFINIVPISLIWALKLIAVFFIRNTLLLMITYIEIFIRGSTSQQWSHKQPISAVSLSGGFPDDDSENVFAGLYLHTEKSALHQLLEIRWTLTFFF